MWDLIVSVPDHCLSFYYENVKDKEPMLSRYKKSEYNTRKQTII